MARVRLWIREDGEQPKAVALDATKGPGPGRLVDVLGTRNADDARKLLAVALSAEPSELKDASGWVAWRAARRAVVELGQVLPMRHDAHFAMPPHTGGDA